MVDSRPVAAGLASGDTYTSATVVPLRSSLPSERVKPSSARCAIRSCGLAAASGVVPTTATRAEWPRLRSSGVKNSYNPLSPSGVVMPVASKTSPPNWSAQRPPRLLPTRS